MFESPIVLRHAASRQQRKLFSIVHRCYATQTSLGTTGKKRHKPVTVLNDDGRVRWGDLTTGEKFARTSQQSFNFSIIVIGLVMTGGVFTLLYTDVFSSQSRTNHFNRAVDQIKKDNRCIELLGPSKKITAYGEPTWNKWRRNRPIATTIQKDKFGIETMYMHFNVSGPLNDGVVNLQMSRSPNESQYRYKFLALDVRGHERIYLENADADKGSKAASNGFKLLGKRWG